MKKTLVYGAATAAILLAAGACVTCTRQVQPSLYGPPPEDIIEPADPEEPTEPADIDEPIEDVYGPPIDYDVDSVIVDEEGRDSNLVAVLYGPPPEDEASIAALYGPPPEVGEADESD